MEKKSIGKNILIIISIIVLFGALGYIAYDKIIVKENKEPVKAGKNVQDNTKSNENGVKLYTYSDIKGEYVYKGQEIYNEAMDGNITPEYKLYLYDNGMFYYNYAYIAGEGKIGNYTIVNNTIVLNNLFDTHSDVSLTTTNGTKALTINEDGSLTDSNQPIDIVKEKTIILKKTSNDANYQDIKNKFKWAFENQ